MRPSAGRPLAAGEKNPDNLVNPVEINRNKNRIHSTSLNLFEVSYMGIYLTYYFGADVQELITLAASNTLRVVSASSRILKGFIPNSLIPIFFACSFVRLSV